MLRQIQSFSRRSTTLSNPDLNAVFQNISHTGVSRRGLLKGLGGFVLAAGFMPVHRAQAFELYPTQGPNMPHGVVTDPKIFVSIDDDGTVTIVAHRTEMGTGSRTTLPMIIADEMEADWNRVKIIQAPGDEPRYGNQDTDGSRSLRHHIQPARQIGAAMRQMLEAAAAKQWDTGSGDVLASNHEVLHQTREQSLGYGELAQAAMDLEPPALDTLQFKDEKDFRYIGKGEVKITDLHDITTGKAVFGADVSLPGMKIAVIARPPVVGAEVRSVDDREALAVNGVEQIIEIPVTPLGSKFKPLGGVAVIATSTWAAIQGRQALKIEWGSSEHDSFNTQDYQQELRASTANPGTMVRSHGDADAALEAADRTLTFEYYQPHLAHTPMEPPAALASVADGKCEIWAPAQSPYVARTDTAEYIGMDPANVTFNVTLAGGGFGRKSKADFASEAAYLSKQTGDPVRVQWTREDDIRHSYYHTSSVERIDVGLDHNDEIVAWRHRSAAPSFLSTFTEDQGVQHEIEVGMGLENLPYDIANIRAEQCKAFAHTRIGWYRSVSNIPRAFAIQSATAELAEELGRDQKDFLLDMIGEPRILDAAASGLPGKFWNQYEPYDEFPFDTGRLSNVVKLAAEEAGWGRELPDGEGMGIAAHRSFVSYIATVVHVKVEDGKVTVPTAHVAVDAGYIANPERVRSQMEGACVFGMTAALYSGITFENGVVKESNFHDYQMLRSSSFPEVVHTHLVAHPFAVHATGVGEPGVPPFLPAFTNAIFNATGIRIRDLPVGQQLES